MTGHLFGGGGGLGRAYLTGSSYECIGQNLKLTLCEASVPCASVELAVPAWPSCTEVKRDGE